MSIFYVRKNGSGTHTTIQSAFIQAVSGDTIDVGPGVFEENVDFFKSGITLKGAGKDQTEIKGVLESNVTKACTFTSGSTTLSFPSGTEGFKVGRFLSGLGLATNTRITSVSSTSITVSAATTSARTNQSLVMTAIPSAVVVRGANHIIKDLKITAPQALETRCLADNAAIFFRNTGNGEVPASGYVLEDCIIEARGESAIMTDAAAGVGNGIIRRNTIQGQSFVGSSAAQVPAFGTMAKTGTVLSARTIQFSDLSGITAPHAGNSQGSEITPGLRVASISGNVVTVTANIPDAVGTSRSFSFANIQFNFPNVARQLVVIQGNNAATQFLNNTVKGKTGSGISYNTAATIDAANAVITGNTINGEFKYGYALRARGAGATVSNNVNYSLPGKENAGYLIGPTGAQSSGMTVGTNTSIVKALTSSVQTAGLTSVTFEMNKELIKQNSKVSSHPIFSQESNWKLVNFVYKHATSSRRLVSSFRSFSGSKKTKLKANMKVGDVFELHKIIISKADRNFLVLKRSDISGASDFDFSLLNDGPSSSESGGGSGGGSGEVQNFTLDSSLKDSSITLSNNGLTATRTSQGSYNYVSSLLNRPVLLSGSDKLYFEITVNNTASSGIDAFGFVFNTTTPTTFGSNNLTLPGFPSNQALRVIIQGSTIYKHSYLTGIQPLQGGFDFQNNAVLGVAVDVAAKTFFFVRNGTASNTFSFADVSGSSTELYFGVGPFAINDQYSINSTPVHLPAGYTSALIGSSSNSSGGGGQVDPPAPEQASTVFFDNISSGVTRNGNEVLVASNQLAQRCYSNTSLGPQGDDFELVFNISNVSPSSNNIQVGFLNPSNPDYNEVGYASYRAVINRSTSRITLLDVNSNTSSFVIPSSSSYEIKLLATGTSMALYVNGTLTGTMALGYAQALQQRLPFCYAGANNSMTVSASKV